ncbi:MAG: sulfite exporter TauE/SafE family protein [Gemmatimonadaceae bacterium]
MNFTPMELIGALAIGIALGLLGGGGSILTVPVFVYAAGLDPKVAVAASLPIVALTSASAAIAHWRLGNVQIRTALVFGLTAAVGSFMSARMASRIPGAVQFTLLALVMLGAAYRMMTTKAPVHASGPESAPIAYGQLIPVAFGVGLLTGVVGIGGGFLIVPTLVLLCHLPMRVAVGTSLVVIALNASSGAAGYFGRTNVPWNTIALFSVISITGSLGASKLSTRVPQLALRKGFGVLLLGLAALILVQNRHVFTALLPS